MYYRVLKDKLTPLLKNHLIPRVQAMIILGQAGIPDFLPLYEAQIKDPNQTLWVKLWALEGMVNVIEEGGRLNAQDQILAAKTVADFVNKETDLPWPVQLRAMEALSAMRQGYEPNQPKKALMANAAMALLDRCQRQAGSPIRGGASPGADADLSLGSRSTTISLSPTPPASSPPSSAVGSRPASPAMKTRRNT